MSYIQKQTLLRKRRLAELQERIRNAGDHSSLSESKRPEKLRNNDQQLSNNKIYNSFGEDEGTTVEILARNIEKESLSVSGQIADAMGMELRSGEEKEGENVNQKASVTKDLKLRMRSSLEQLDKQTEKALKRILRERLIKESANET
ncbi:hypothetical protein NCAS_0B02110 [Naumovozyma castellii]|uniref:Uncharacterized protein n=1 Tax=Naumovozyma castellii TaxID=27288 RepID=G0VBG9_NAUCA|nr:hypothetical protein NCAS_0B02110 [Naumovozyma castellii CBS 4309]CCC68295.1 hypothetical protein NCAS_0B02110 [Naumovozyma castellii CBS 4309]